MYKVNLVPEPVSEDSKRDLTFGERAVGINFNPSFDENVDRAKAIMAEAIDQMNNLRDVSTLPGQKRHASIAITMLEDAQMRMVKAVTWNVD